MQDDLQKAYSAYQQALYWLPNPKEDPKLWYGIGILYDRYGSLDHAEEAFASVLRMDRGEQKFSFNHLGSEVDVFLSFVFKNLIKQTKSCFVLGSYISSRESIVLAWMYVFFPFLIKLHHDGLF